MSSFFDQGADAPPVGKKRRIPEGQQQQVGLFSKQNEERYDDDDDDDDGRPVLSRTGGGGGGGGGRVGMRLLQSMHAASASSSSLPPPPSSLSSSSSNVLSTPAVVKKMRLVEDYVPLSVGGFMDTTTEARVGPMTSMGHLRPGDIMCLRTPAPTPTGPCRSATPGLQFVREADLSAEERRYGRRLTCDMMQGLFEVSRVDPAANSLEAIFLDGTRQKLNMYAVRPAGFVEAELFRQWKADPSSRPVRTVYASCDPAVPPSSLPAEASAGGSSSNRNNDEGGGDQDNTTHDKSIDGNSNTANTAATSMPWWVTPQLVVRVIEESAGDLFGAKFVVRFVSRCENRIRLSPWQPTAVASGGEVENSLVDIVGCEALETVVPKVGDQGILVQGKLRGELVTVVARHRNTEAEPSTVKVSSTRTGEEFTVEPHEVCQLALNRPRPRPKLRH